MVFRLSIGGLENGVVNLINHMPQDRWRHAVIALTSVDRQFAQRIRRPDVRLIELNKPPGQGLLQLSAWHRTARELKPDLVHTRNLAALDFQLPAWLAGVRGRVHSEHGRDVDDLHGNSRKHIWMRRMLLPLVQQVIALGEELSTYCRDRVGVSPGRLHTIYNGVDTSLFVPVASAGSRAPLAGLPFESPDLWRVGTVGRMQAVKAQTVLAKAFVQVLQARPELRSKLRLILVGDGPLRSECAQILNSAGLSDLAWLPGERADVADVMRSLDCFVLPSLAEGISNTILEAMSTGLPVLATRVGANSELVAHERTGLLVPSGNVDALANGLMRMVDMPNRSAAWGQQGRLEVERRFSLQAMVAGYEAVYRQVLGRLAPSE